MREANPPWSLGHLSDYLVAEAGMKTGPFGSSLTKASYAKHGHRVYGQEQVIGGDLNIGNYYISESKFREMSAFAVAAGDLLLSLVGTIGRSLIVAAPFETGIINPRLMRLRCDQSRTQVGFLSQILGSTLIRTQLEATATGGTMPVLNGRVLKALRVPVVPLSEQRQIAAILDTIDDAIRKTEQIIAKLKQVKQGLLHDLLTRGIDANGELRDPECHPEQFKDSPLGRIPGEWTIARLLDHVTLPSGQVDPRIEPFRSWTLVAPDHIEGNTGRLLERKSAEAQSAISGKYVFEPGDVVYSKIRPYLRKAILAGFGGLCSADMYPLRPTEGVDPSFLLSLVLGEHFSRFAEVVSMRSGFPKINREELGEYSAPFPPPAEQQMIGSFLLEHDRHSAREEATLNKLRLLKAGLMEDLLTGRVRVTKLLETAAE